MRILIITIFSLFVVSCQSEAEKNQANADKMIAEAMENAEKLKAEAEAKVAAAEAKAMADYAQEQAEEETAKAQAAADAVERARQQQAAIQPNQSMGQYNGFYLNNRNKDGVLIFTDGILTFFDFAHFKNTYKNEEYNVGGMTADNYFDIKAKYHKDRKGNVAPKATILKEVMPIMEKGICIKLERRGYTFERVNSFGELMHDRHRYPFKEFMQEFKAKYNRSDAEIEVALANPKFYESDFFAKAEFYGNREPLIDALESIIQQ